MAFMGGLRKTITSKINTARGSPGASTFNAEIEKNTSKNDKNSDRNSDTNSDKNSDKNVQISLPNTGTGKTFVIDEEEDEDDGMGPREEVDPQKIGISRTDQERAQGILRIIDLAVHYVFALFI
jgi:hypothetical protein